METNIFNLFLRNLVLRICLICALSALDTHSFCEYLYTYQYRKMSIYIYKYYIYIYIFLYINKEGCIIYVYI